MCFYLFFKSSLLSESLGKSIVNVKYTLGLYGHGLSGLKVSTQSSLGGLKYFICAPSNVRMLDHPKKNI